MNNEKSIHDQYVYSFILQRHRQLLSKQKPKLKKNELEALAIVNADKEMIRAVEARENHDYKNSYFEFRFK